MRLIPIDNGCRVRHSVLFKRSDIQAEIPFRQVPMLNPRCLTITIRGIVQGVGFRPFVYKTANAAGLGGWVLNESDAVRIQVAGEATSLDKFLKALRTESPGQARIESLDVQEIPFAGEMSNCRTFQIRPSVHESLRRPVIPSDMAPCDDCLREIRDPQERRYRYPFTNCTNCGPRWSIIRELPYDRPGTSMGEFKMCAGCRAEYDDPDDRRFHAQPIACPECGPRLTLLGCDGARLADGDEALRGAVETVLSGKTVALKGVGGFQLIVDATNPDAVARLRTRKNRPDKPFALMLEDLDTVRKRCIAAPDELAALSSTVAPIILFKRRADNNSLNDIAAEVAPGNPDLGVMLPSSPLHHLFLGDVARPLVCTSGNLSEEPIATGTDDALRHLRRIADVILTHSRAIVRPVDDSVARVDSGRLQLLRRARGFAPVPIRLAESTPCVIAVGGHLKNTVALSLNEEVVMSAHVGDLDNLRSLNVHRRAVSDLVSFFGVTPEAVVCDRHPDYASTRHAEQLAASWDAPLIRVQHHHAHVAACVAEHKLDESVGPVLGLSWDGTGYGLDGTAWGGEALLCSGSEFERIGHLRTFLLPGGDKAAREPRRSALGLLFEILGADAAPIAESWFTEKELGTLLQALGRPRLFPRTSALGRLFDAVATLCGLTAIASFEGQAAMGLEFAADHSVTEAYPFPVSRTTPAIADWEPLVRAILEDLRHGVSVARIAAQFHNALANMAHAMSLHAGTSQVVLTGGCFQNQMLTSRVKSRLSKAGWTVYTHHHVPPGDGGLALGQILIAARKMKGRSDVSRNSRQTTGDS